VNEKVSRDMTGEADGMNQGVDSRDGVMHICNLFIEGPSLLLHPRPSGGLEETE